MQGANASPAVVEVADEPLPHKKRLSKKVLLMLAGAALLLATVGGGATYWIKHQAEQASTEATADGEEGPAQDERAPPPAKVERAERRGPPTFVPLDAFTVNLADKETERYAQVGVTLEIEEPKQADRIKLYMPAIRNAILMILAHKSSPQLLERTGKEQLAREIQIEAARAMEVELADVNPVRKVHFSNFIIQ